MISRVILNLCLDQYNVLNAQRLLYVKTLIKEICFLREALMSTEVHVNEETYCSDTKYIEDAKRTLDILKEMNIEYEDEICSSWPKENIPLQLIPLDSAIQNLRIAMDMDLFIADLQRRLKK
ncbi:MAG: hypothetical protein N2749_00615 [Clostridia bacterium]|nr:hypothetical protein [Clostridia bacterium]